MFVIRPAAQRGHTKTPWLDSHHTFSFGGYYDPKHMGFSVLRVINDDIVGPGGGFDMHPHDNMEIISLVLSGALEHKDSLGTGSVIKPGDVQKMTAGTGIRHSEFNPSDTESVHFLQIWILPDRHHIKPSYEQKNFGPNVLHNKLGLVASKNGQDESIIINQDMWLYQSMLDSGKSVSYQVRRNRPIWIQVAEGAITVNEYALNAGDGLAIWEEEIDLKISGTEKKSTFLLFDLPK